MQHLLPSVCPVHPGRFVQLRIYRGDGGQINDGSPSHGLPGPYYNVSDKPACVFLEEVDRRASQALNQRVYHTCIYGKELVSKAADDNP